jgi:PhzF family phenazine biosynthesis protein
MQAIAAEVGYSETAFLVARPREPNVYDIRYFAPLQEVPFCGMRPSPQQSPWSSGHRQMY